MGFLWFGVGFRALFHVFLQKPSKQTNNKIQACPFFPLGTLSPVQGLGFRL